MPTFTRDRDHDDRPGRRSRLRPGVLVPAGAGAAVLLALALVLFEPWTLFVDGRVDEAAPVAAQAPATEAAPDPAAPDAGAAGTASPAETADDAPGDDAGTTPAPARKAPARKPKAAPKPVGPVTLLKGRFVSHEHGTSGRAEVLRLADGSRVLRISDLDTSNGPDLRVWLTDAPVRKGRAGWFVFDDGRHVELGKLKGNVGNQNYAIPAGVDLKTLRSVSIWCARFRVSFGAVALT